ncbi:MAG TPA: cytochrome P450 [Blastocatellia bacterium]|nr:cytochrome P450 [Blastocatellia bacterium]
MSPVPSQSKPSYKGSTLRILLAMRGDRLSFLQKLKEQHGDVVRFRVATQAVWVLSHPEHIRDVLVVNQKKFMKGRGIQMMKPLLGEGLLTSEGEFHLRQRRLVQPAFHRQRVASYATSMVEDARKIRERWAMLPPGESLEMSQEMMRLTLVIAGRTLFDADVEDEANDVGQALTDAMSVAERIPNPLAAILSRLPLPSNRRFAKARQRLDDIIYGIIRERRASNVDRGDFLSMLLLAQDEEGGTGGMTDQQVRDEALTIFLAGHETTATALTWTWYLLSQHPEAEAKLHAEIDAVLQGRLPTFEDLPKLRYAEMVFAEAMRLYPPAWIIGRRALVEHEMDGFKIKAGDLTLHSQYLVHHDARWFPEPDKFIPERWTPELKESRPKFSYFPFGGGTRTCIGEAFAWMEASLVIATLAQQWKPRLVPGHPVEPRALITLRPKHGMKMYLEKR